MASATFKFSLTELPQFQRLVRFVVEVEDYAVWTQDEDLQAKVDELRKDLIGAST